MVTWQKPMRTGWTRPVLAARAGGSQVLAPDRYVEKTVAEFARHDEVLGTALSQVRHGYRLVLVELARRARPRFVEAVAKFVRTPGDAMARTKLRWAVADFRYLVGLAKSGLYGIEASGAVVTPGGAGPVTVGGVLFDLSGVEGEDGMPVFADRQLVYTVTMLASGAPLVRFDVVGEPGGWHVWVVYDPEVSVQGGTTKSPVDDYSLRLRRDGLMTLSDDTTARADSVPVELNGRRLHVQGRLVQAARAHVPILVLHRKGYEGGLQLRTLSGHTQNTYATSLGLAPRPTTPVRVPLDTRRAMTYAGVLCFQPRPPLRRN